MQWFKTWSLLKPDSVYLLFPISAAGVVGMLSCGWAFGKAVQRNYREGCYVALEMKVPKLEECL